MNILYYIDLKPADFYLTLTECYFDEDIWNEEHGTMMIE